MGLRAACPSWQDSPTPTGPNKMVLWAGLQAQASKLRVPDPLSTSGKKICSLPCCRGLPGCPELLHGLSLGCPACTATQDAHCQVYLWPGPS